MLQFSRWFFVLMLNFLLLIWILNLILFRPFVKVFRERRERANGDLEAAKELGARREEELAAMRKEFELARTKGKELFEGLRAEGLEKQKQVLAQAHENALKRTERIKGELSAETERARQSLRAEAEKFSDGIVEKLVKA